MNNATRKEQRHEARLRKAEAWTAAYNGMHILQAYRKKFRLDMADAVTDLYTLGYLPYKKATSILAEEKRRLQSRIDKIDCIELDELLHYDDTIIYDPLDVLPDAPDTPAARYRKAGKNHAYVDGELRQMSKTFAHLKEKQRTEIDEWLYAEFAAYMETATTPAGKKDSSSVVDKVYVRIEEAGIWIPHEEVYRRFRKKQGRFLKRYKKQ